MYVGDINMGQRMAWWCLILILTFSEVAFRVQTQSQPSTEGFISIDCGPVIKGNKYLVRAIFWYPDDPYDRHWYNNTHAGWTEISTTSLVSPDGNFMTPSKVSETAVFPTNTTDSLDLWWSSTSTSTVLLVVVHISEIDILESTDYREIDIYANGHKEFTDVPEYLVSGGAFYTQTGFTTYNVSVRSTAKSTLAPILNALEVYMVNPVILLPTDTQDVTAINAIKGNYSVNKGWSGDPCLPTNLSWTGISCTLTSSNIPQITGLDLTSSRITGAIISAFGDLTSLKSLDMSNNRLSGSIPSSLDRLTSLTFLDLSGNANLSTRLPPGLQKRKDNGLLRVKVDCEGNRCHKKKTLIIIIVIVVILILLVIAVIATLLLCKKKRYNEITISTEPNGHVGTTPLRNGHPGNYAYSPNNVNAPANNYGRNSNGTHDKEENMLHLESRQFTFNELKMITNNFQNNIGTGGFGSVFVGTLEKGKQVAVKLRSEKSSQGYKEFLAEAQNLTSVHHKNLVSLVGYCMEGEYMALVYEYMPEGTLQDKLRDNFSPLSWKQRLKIGYESAQGLEYLHKSCNPPLVHRDVKTNNILLTANLEAKIADFGLVRAFDGDGTNSHVSTRIVGTPGYLDPDYYTTSQLSEKSDVYSFGVVMLEIVTGKSPIIEGPDGGHLTNIVRQKLSKGNIESIIDPRMGGQYDVNSVWKVAELGLKCTDQALKRPTMTGVVAELKESLDLENSSEGMRSVVSGSTGQYNNSRNDNWISDSNGSGFEMGYMGNVPDAHGPTAR
ncbi:hypothetical protein LUZ60_000469 [Juncus effusus]|nr:hypothetical protein LUZ60_000469 [Juncus effusus]